LARTQLTAPSSGMVLGRDEGASREVKWRHGASKSWRKQNTRMLRRRMCFNNLLFTVDVGAKNYVSFF
jgi:hypothetical protein